MDPKPTAPAPGSQEFELWLDRMQWLVKTRWWAVAALLGATAVGHHILKLDISFPVIGLVSAGLIAVNLDVGRRLQQGGYYPQMALIQVLANLFSLTIVLFATDGIRNPFFTLYFFEIVLARVLLPPKTSYILAALTVLFFFSLFAFAPEMGRFEGAEGIFAEPYFFHVALSPVSFVLTAVFTGYLVTMLMDDLREREQQVLSERDRRRQSEKLAALGQLAGGVAHEINTPLGTIGMAAEDSLSQMDRGAWNEEELKDALGVIRDQTARCSAITRSLLNFSHRSDIQCQQIELQPLIEETVELLRHRAGDAEIDVKTQEPAPSATADPGAVRQILVNLLGNALDAVKNQEGGRIEIRCGSENGRATIDVANNGPGIPEEAQGHIFEPFYTTKEVGQGTGLGLTISYGLARDMGGALDLISSEPGACRFQLRLPLEASS